MIESIHIADVATYCSTVEVLSGLSKFNFIYGSNGSGKTTISRLIADGNRFPSCSIKWNGGTTLQTIVYNRDFIEQNFSQSNEIKGIFTLGEKNIDILEKIAAAKTDSDRLKKEIEALNKTLQGDTGSDGKIGELAKLDLDFKERCWAQKQKHDAIFSGAFEGYRGSSEKFKDKILQEAESNQSSVETFETLEKRAKAIWGSTPASENTIPIVTTDILTHESNPILVKRVFGKEDVGIAAMIRTLGNSDWVREGLSFFARNENICPFCQQHTPESFAKSLEEYFDETFENDNKSIDELDANYKSDSERLQHRVEAIIAVPSKFLDVDKLKIEKTLLDSKIDLNLKRIAAKKKEPSQRYELESLANVLSSLNVIIESANDLINEHNKVVANLAQEKKRLTAQAWKYLLEIELKEVLAEYKKKRTDLLKAIDSLKNKIEAAKKKNNAKDVEIQELEKETTSIQPTIDKMNAILHTYGCRGFKFAKADNGPYYKLLRADGTDVKETLSEGEKSFVTFLYFYQLLKGSDSESGMTTDRVVVFDDPVSSLDSDILFIVGSLIKCLFEEVRSGTGHLKQIFVLTHNVYFHKEVTFNPKRCEEAMKEETFWVVRKVGLVSKVERQKTNPIKTSYELLWAEVRNPNHSSLTIQNTLRRILEHYFRILGRIDNDEICERFDGHEKLLCKSMLSWVNDGSHSVHDDLYLSMDGTTVATYLKVFRKIFERTNHQAHYRMMMGEAYEEETAQPIVQ